jgi:hypothetical protein
MSTRSVRLDEEAENALDDIVDRTGMTISDAIKQGLIAYRQIAIATASKRPADFFQSYDLGEGGYAAGPARHAKKVLKDRLRSRAGRRQR